VIQAAVARALKESFPYVRVFHSFDGRGFHFLASNQRLAQGTAQELAERMPARAAQDFVEDVSGTVADKFHQVRASVGERIEATFEAVDARKRRRDSSREFRWSGLIIMLMVRMPSMSSALRVSSGTVGWSRCRERGDRICSRPS